MLAPLLDSKIDSVWTFNNADEHRKIVQAIDSKLKLSLTLFCLDPIPTGGNTRVWLQNHQSMHADMNTVLGLPGSDLSQLDFQNARQVVAWNRLHFQEHFNANQALGL